MKRTSDPRHPVTPSPRHPAAAVGNPQAGFDQAYFQRFYENPTTQVAAPADYGNLASFIAAYLRLLNLPVARILDVGAGVDGFQRPLVREFPGCEYQGIDVSQYACARYGW